MGSALLFNPLAKENESFDLKRSGWHWYCHSHSFCRERLMPRIQTLLPSVSVWVPLYIPRKWISGRMRPFGSTGYHGVGGYFQTGYW